MTNYNNAGKPEKNEEKVEDTRPVYEVVYSGNLNFRAEPGGKVIFELKHGEKVKYVGETEEYDGFDWIKVEARGKTGFVMSKYMDLVE